ncbi:hypothetical protein HK098_002579 [Nowakowskiella sp. JEL0407]|nr:hypothetical protein HK098_002579 [Nowakowskiella sp. JEL0407]
MSLQADVLAAYEDVRNDKSPTNWMRIDYVDEKSDILQVSATGTGGLEEFISTLQPNEAVFGYVRVLIGNDELSQRAKFVLISWCGTGVKVMRKAKLSVHIGEVKKIVKSFAIEVQASTEADLKIEDIHKLLKKAMGANYDR